LIIKLGYIHSFIFNDAHVNVYYTSLGKARQSLRA